MWSCRLGEVVGSDPAAARSRSGLSRTRRTFFGELLPGEGAVTCAMACWMTVSVWWSEGDVSLNWDCGGERVGVVVVVVVVVVAAVGLDAAGVGVPGAGCLPGTSGARGEMVLGARSGSGEV